MKTRTFNSKCDFISKYILEKKPIKKTTIKENVEKIPTIYIYSKTLKEQGGSNCWIVEDPELLMQRLIELEFKYYDPNLLPLEQLDQMDLEQD